MKIGHSEKKTAIATADEVSVTIRGFDLTDGLIGHVNFTEFFFLLMIGHKPTAEQRDFLDATLIAIAEHGLTPSVVAGRMTYAAAPEALQGAVAAGILGCGQTVLGSAESAAHLLHDGVSRSREQGRSLHAVADRATREMWKAKQRLPGFGHPLHKPTDPRCERLLSLAEARGAAGDHCYYARELQTTADTVWGRHMVMNVSMAIPAVMLDLDFPLAVMKGIPILARTAGLLAHLQEEDQRPVGFEMAHLASEGIAYDRNGPG